MYIFFNHLAKRIGAGGNVKTAFGFGGVSTVAVDDHRIAETLHIFGKIAVAEIDRHVACHDLELRSSFADTGNDLFLFGFKTGIVFSGTTPEIAAFVSIEDTDYLNTLFGLPIFGNRFDALSISATVVAVDKACCACASKSFIAVTSSGK